MTITEQHEHDDEQPADEHRAPRRDEGARLDALDATKVALWRHLANVTGLDDDERTWLRDHVAALGWADRDELEQLAQLGIDAQVATLRRAYASRGETLYVE